MPISDAASAPKAWLMAVRCGTAVICTRPSGMPMIAPTTSAIRIHWNWTSSGLKKVVSTAIAAPISPASTPRRAVAGELSHFSDRMKSAMAMI